MTNTRDGKALRKFRRERAFGRYLFNPTVKALSRLGLRTALATELDAKYAGQGIRVVYCEDAYKKSNADYDSWLESKGYSPGGHASINDTSEMMYVEPAPDAWVRRDKLPEAVGKVRVKTVPPTPRDPKEPTNGVSGDGRRSSAELGKYGYDIHVSESVAQIRQLLAPVK